MFIKSLQFTQIFEWLEYFGIKNIASFSIEKVKYFGYLCVNFLIKNISITFYGYVKQL